MVAYRSPPCSMRRLSTVARIEKPTSAGSPSRSRSEAGVRLEPPPPRFLYLSTFMRRLELFCLERGLHMPSSTSDVQATLIDR